MQNSSPFNGPSANRAVELPVISSFGLTSALLFIVFSFIGRFLFPFGDEPDFEVRSYGVQFDPDHPWWSPYSIFHQSFVGMKRDGECDIVATPLSLWAHIPSNCGEDLKQILTRFGITILLSILLMLPIVFRRMFVRVADPHFSRLSAGEWSLRLDALGLAILLPSVVSALGVFAEEQSVVLLSLLLVLMVPNLLLTVSLLILVFALDFGNGMVVFTAVFLLWANRLLLKRFGFRTLVGIVMVELAGIMVIGVVFVDFMSTIGFLADKAGGLLAVLTDSDSPANKYPVILRPIVTFMTGIYMTGLNVKVVPLYPIFGIAIAVGMWRFRRFSHTPGHSYYGFAQGAGSAPFEEVRLHFITALNVVLFFVFLLPTYSNAKYYLFLIPFFLIGALQVFPRNQIQGLFIISSLTVFVALILFRIT